MIFLHQLEVFLVGNHDLPERSNFEYLNSVRGCENLLLDHDIPPHYDFHMSDYANSLKNCMEGFRGHGCQLDDHGDGGEHGQDDCNS